MIVSIQYSAFDAHVDQMNMERYQPDMVKAVPSASVSIELPDCFAEHMEQADRDKYICELMFDNTNTYEGPLWNRLDGKLPENRTHTALSVGDRVSVDSRVYQCASFGWEAE